MLSNIMYYRGGRHCIDDCTPMATHDWGQSEFKHLSNSQTVKASLEMVNASPARRSMGMANVG